MSPGVKGSDLGGRTAFLACHMAEQQRIHILFRSFSAFQGSSLSAFDLKTLGCQLSDVAGLEAVGVAGCGAAPECSGCLGSWHADL